MRPARWMIACFCLLCCACAMPAQEVNVSVGSVTRYTGIEADKSHVGDLKSIRNFLNALEAQIARAFLDHPEMDYMDRMNTDALFQELHLSSDAAFNPNSGALRGLLGRLDYLVVMDASDPATARVRLIDVKTGAVKAVETCARRGNDLTAPACVGPFVNRAVMVAKATLRERLETQQRLAEVNQQLAEVKPELDDLNARLRSQLGFWKPIADQLAASGQPLRGSTQVLLDRARADDRDCHSYFGNSDVEMLHACVGRLRADVDELETLRKQMQQ